MRPSPALPDWLAPGRPAASRFRAALAHPRLVQERRLSSLLRRNADSRYGRRFGFRAIGSVREYQARIPIVGYDAIEEEIQEIRRGQAGVLTEEPVRMLEKTTGSTAASKYIPYTASLLRELRAGLYAWMADLYGRRPHLGEGSAYWSVSPLSGEPEISEGGLRVGFEEDTEYFGRAGARLARTLATPGGLARIPEVESARYVTLRFLLDEDRLRFISVWHPSFLSLLLESLAVHAERLLEDIAAGTLRPPAALPSSLALAWTRRLGPRPARAARLAEIWRRHQGLPARLIWPNLEVISCWASAGAAPYAAELARIFPGVEIQPKGLLATEGLVSLPWTGVSGAALAVTSHFLEFLDAEGGARLVDELREGETYSVLLTTGGGLYRYALGDRVRVVGRLQATPLVEFVGRDDRVSDLCGEKLHELRVGMVLADAFRAGSLQPAFALLAPEQAQPPAYVLYLECPGLSAEDLRATVRRVEGALRQGHHYDYCRRLGQLGPLRGFRIEKGGSRAFFSRLAALGQRAGAIKPTPLDRRSGWSDWFEGTALEATLVEVE